MTATKRILAGHILPNGAIVVAARRDGDSYAIVLCLRPGMRYQPYVVWILDLESKAAFGGDYHHELGAALSAFNHR